MFEFLVLVLYSLNNRGKEKQNVALLNYPICLIVDGIYSLEPMAIKMICSDDLCF